MAEKKAEKKTENKKGVKKTTDLAKTSKKVTKKEPKKEEKQSSVKVDNVKKAKTQIVQEENNYNRTILAAVLILIIFVGGYLAIQYKKNGGFSKKNDYVATEDEKRFKDEYESLNGTTRASNGQKNKEISILDDNNIKYITIEEAFDIIDSGSGIIYFGFAACPWCRNAVPVLLNAMDSTSLDTIYYVNVRPDDDPQKDIRDTFTLNTKNKARKTKDAVDAYYKVLTALANELDPYILVSDDGKKVDTGEKRLGAPTVIAVLNGELIGFHQGTVEGHVKDSSGALRDLTEEETTTLLNTYSSMITKYLDSDCGSHDEGC